MTAGWLRGAAVIGLGLAAIGCSRPPNLVVAHDPLPPPSPAFAARCYSSPTIFHGYASACRAVVAPALLEERTVIRTKG
jgi:hypothetical protein